jgi:hypothetical protein
MPIKNCYVVKIIDKSRDEYGKYYNGGMYWLSINNAMNYTLDYVNLHLSLTPGVHEVLRVEPDGTLTHIR